MVTRPTRPKPPSYPHADRELTPEEVRERFGPTLDAFYDGLREDVGLLTTLAREAVRVGERQDRRRAAEKARAERKRAAREKAQTVAAAE
jgi:hypothetical protein